jgi:hypothetical protein
MERRIDYQVVRRPQGASWKPLVAVWAVFAALAAAIGRGVGCPLAGCSNTTIALVAGVALAFGLATLLTHSDRLAARQRSQGKR